jgi:NitT/TauT family transport system substrate-binding protein
MNSKSFVILIIFVGFILFLFNPYKKDDNDLSIRIGFFPNITHSQALVGKTTGKFEKALGTKVEWKKFNAGPSEIEALMAGELDLGYIGPGPAINGYVKTRGDLQIIAGASDAGAVLVSRKDVVIKNIKQLNGKKIAVPQYGNTQDLTLRHLLKINGLKPSTQGGKVEIIQADNPDIKLLFDQKAIDAAIVPEPWGSRLIKENNAKLVLDYNQVWKNGNYPTAVVIARTDFIKKHPDLVKKFLKTHVELTDYINAHSKESKKLLNQQIKELTNKSIPDDVLNSSFKRVKVTVNPEKAAIDELISLSLEAGFIKGKPDAKGLFNLTILNNVLNEKGKKKIN